MLDPIGFGTADANIAACDLIEGLKFIRSLIPHVQNILRPLAKKHPCLCELNSKAAAGKQLFPSSISNSLICLDKAGWEM